MAYSTNPNLPKARAIALRLLVLDQLPIQVVANRCGINRTTVWRWKRKWNELDMNARLTNDNRPQRAVGSRFRHATLSWNVPTLVSRSRTTNPNTVSKNIVARVLELRTVLKRALVTHGRRQRVRRTNPRRPLVTKPGELVQTDTIHYVCPLTKRRRYVYTVIDLYTRRPMPDEDVFNALFDKTQSNKIGVIPNAWMTYPEEKSLPYIKSLKNKLDTMGFETITVNLLGIKDNTDELKELLYSLQEVWLTAGNTFYLNWAIHQSGFQNVISELVNNGLVYGGESAGAVMADKTLHGIENLDNPEEPPETIWDGLGLVDFGVIPYWDNDKYGSLLKKMQGRDAAAR